MWTRVRCKRCSGGLRPLFMERMKDWFLICDHCRVGTVAPRSMHDFLSELTNAAH